MDIKRYDVGGYYGYGYCDEEEQGDWVLFDDHYAVVASLQAEHALLQSELTKARELLTQGAYFGPGIWGKQVLDFLAHQSAPAAKNPTNQSPNQCDGCQAGIPVETNQYGTPLHRMGSEGGYPDYMACTAKLYLKD